MKRRQSIYVFRAELGSGRSQRCCSWCGCPRHTNTVACCWQGRLSELGLLTTSVAAWGREKANLECGKIVIGWKEILAWTRAIAYTRAPVWKRKCERGDLDVKCLGGAAALVSSGSKPDGDVQRMQAAWKAGQERRTRTKKVQGYIICTKLSTKKETCATS